ncbi:hypothetical protein, partial [Streptomyces sp. SP18BB07]|uniref:hypothetical protein n=1 Tax=Streptomyces sp. SP18BB07 TaxID=3002522 RepID=UPI002E76272D
MHTKAESRSQRVELERGLLPGVGHRLLTFPLSCRIKREACFGEATVDQVGLSLDLAQAAADCFDEVVAVGE